MRTVVIYPGRFHPFHRGHKASYDYLVKRYGADNVFVVSSDKQDPETSPFSFADKMHMMTKLGIAPGHIAQVKNPYQAQEIRSEIDDPENTVLIFAVSEKDMAGQDARFNFKPKKDGTPGYMQPMTPDGKGLQNMTKHAYVAVTPTVNFQVRGVDANSASQIRKQYIAGNNADREQIIADLYGDMDAGIKDIFDQKLGTGTPEQIITYGQEQIYAGDKQDVRESREIIKENIAGTLLALFADLLRQLRLIRPEQFDQWKKDQAESVKQEMIALLRHHPYRDAIAPMVHKMTARLNDAENALQFARALRLMSEFFNRAVELREMPTQNNEDYIEERWSQKYKRSINCSNPQGFSQRAHCQGRKK